MHVGKSSLPYLAALDGLRAVAILPVLIFHALPGALRGGFTGVDVFFVISGYLITSVVLHGIDAARFSLLEFYKRRIQRLLPNALLMIAATLVLTTLALPPSTGVNVAHHGLWTLINLSNLYACRHFGGYWGETAASAPLLHTWSLAVEEQFYLLFPPLIFVLVSVGRARLLLAVSGLVCASFIMSLVAVKTDAAVAFYSLHTRAWEPLLGAVLAICLQRTAEIKHVARNSFASEVAGIAGMAMLFVSFIAISERRPYPGFSALIPTIGTMLVLISIAKGRTTTARILSTPLLVTIGILSYSLYLWHWPLIVVTKNLMTMLGLSPWLGGVIGLGLSVPVAVLAFLCVEQPLRVRGPGVRPRLIIIAAAFFLCVVGAGSIAVRRVTPDPMGIFEQPIFSGFRYSVLDNSAFSPPTSVTRYSDVLFTPPEQHPPQIWARGGIVHRWGPGDPRVVVLGSSHALMFSSLIDDICRREGFPVSFLCADDAPVFFPTVAGRAFATPRLARLFDDSRKRWIAEWKPAAVLLIHRWDLSNGPDQNLEVQLRRLISELEPYSGSLLLFTQVPALRCGEALNLRELVSWHLFRFGCLPSIMPDENEPFRKKTLALFDRLARDHPSVSIVPVHQNFYLADGSVRYASGRKFLYSDNDHLTVSGAELARDICAQAIYAACRTGSK